jgi:hypothetical protein
MAARAPGVLPSQGRIRVASLDAAVYHSSLDFRHARNLERIERWVARRQVVGFDNAGDDAVRRVAL